MRQVVLDTETTGIGTELDHRIIEIGCVELINRKLTGNHFHVYINPQREVDAEAVEVHGIDNQFLADKPLYHQIAGEFLEFIRGAELVIHNAPFDVGFMDHEFKKLSGYPMTNDVATVLDTLVLARSMFPGQRNSLDALCKRFGIDNSHRTLHGALLDAEILADVYLMMTGGQTDLNLANSTSESGTGLAAQTIDLSQFDLPVVQASELETDEHNKYIELLDKKSGGSVKWNQ